MAELLKNKYPLEVAKTIGGMIVKVYPEFDSTGFIKHVAKGYEQLELMDRGRKISAALKVFLPDNFKQAVTILLASLDSPYEQDPENSLASFIFMPHTMFVTENGLDDFDTSMAAHYQLTQRFTSEFAIRPFIERYPEQSLGLLKQWAVDANYHVRRLVSEGTRPKLPWAKSVTLTQDQTVPLLTQLHGDPTRYVTRSVANHLNDIAKIDADLVVELLKGWAKTGKQLPKEVEWMTRHGLRTLVKQGHAGALDLLGFKADAPVQVTARMLTPSVKMGDAVSFEVDISAETTCPVLVAYRIDFARADGKRAQKVFKLKQGKVTPKAPLKMAKFSCGIHHPANKLTIFLPGICLLRHSPG